MQVVGLEFRSQWSPQSQINGHRSCLDHLDYLLITRTPLSLRVHQVWRLPGNPKGCLVDVNFYFCLGLFWVILFFFCALGITIFQSIVFLVWLAFLINWFIFHLICYPVIVYKYPCVFIILLIIYTIVWSNLHFTDSQVPGLVFHDEIWSMVFEF